MKKRELECGCIRCREIGHKSLKEKIEIDESNVGLSSNFYEASEGDCRKAINLLQATASVSLNINSEMINMIAVSTKPV